MPKARRGLYTPPQHAPQLPNLTPPAVHPLLGFGPEPKLLSPTPAQPACLDPAVPTPEPRTWNLEPEPCVQSVATIFVGGTELGALIALQTSAWFNLNPKPEPPPLKLRGLHAENGRRQCRQQRAGGVPTSTL